ncbi:MAG TPA: ATP-binding protein [Pseudolabrys sp.]|nr:ATP-binding protein [Pseudolabrys sp.]
MGRLRIAGRLALIVVGAIVFVQMLMIAVYFIEQRRQPERGGFALLLGQIAALTQALDKVPPNNRELVLRAATSLRFTPTIRQNVPDNVVHSALLGNAERRLRALIGAPEDRFIALSFISRNGGQPISRLRDVVGARLHAVVGLNSGAYLDVETAGELTMRLLGVPVGLLAGILGFGVALAALIAVRRETKPLSELTGAVERFGAAAEPQPVAERGAPDVRALIGAVNAMQARIAELLRSRTLVLGAISHDLRTYVTRLRLRLELLPESEQRTKAAADLDGMQSLMDDALVFARASFAGGPDETVDLAQAARSEYEARKAQHAPITLAGADAPLVVRGSRAGVTRVVANLVGNALAYGGCADVSLHPEGDFAELWVEDRGPGIPAGERAQVFEPFYRLEPSRNRDSGGAGLGLTIVRQIVESNRGTVSIEDRPGGGVRMRVRLPRASVQPTGGNPAG